MGPALHITDITEPPAESYALHSRVTVVPLNVEGRVLAIRLDSLGAQYQVRYFDHGEAYIEYFFPDELRP